MLILLVLTFCCQPLFSLEWGKQNSVSLFRERTCGTKFFPIPMFLQSLKREHTLPLPKVATIVTTEDYHYL